MTTVTQLLDHLIKAAGDMGKLKDLIPSALIKARARIQHLELLLAATETMRDRLAMQLLPAIQDKASRGTPVFDTDDCIRLAYHQADKVLRIRVEGSAGAPGETTSPEISAPEFAVGDKFKLPGGVATITDVYTDENGVRFYDFASKKRGYEGNFTAADIVDLQERAGEEQ